MLRFWLTIVASITISIITLFGIAIGFGTQSDNNIIIFDTDPYTARIGFDMLDIERAIRVNLTNDSIDAIYPRWSPDGQKLCVCNVLWR